MEGKYLHDKSEQPLSIILIDAAATTASVVARVRVHYGQLRVSRVGESSEEPVPEGNAYSGEVNQLLREAVRGLRFAKELRKRTRAPWRTGCDDSYVLAQHKLTLSPIEVDD